MCLVHEFGQRVSAKSVPVVMRRMGLRCAIRSRNPWRRYDSYRGETGDHVHNLLERLGIRQSMSRKGNCLDNAATEQVFGHLKDEFYRGRESSTRTNSSNANWTPTSSIGTPDGVRYDSRDTPRRSSGACPSRSRAVSSLTTSNKRGAIQSRGGVRRLFLEAFGFSGGGLDRSACAFGIMIWRFHLIRRPAGLQSRGIGAIL